MPTDTERFDHYFNAYRNGYVDIRVKANNGATLSLERTEDGTNCRMVRDGVVHACTVYGPGWTDAVRSLWADATR